MSLLGGAPAAGSDLEMDPEYPCDLQVPAICRRVSVGTYRFKARGADYVQGWRSCSLDHRRLLGLWLQATGKWALPEELTQDLAALRESPARLAELLDRVGDPDLVARHLGELGLEGLELPGKVLLDRQQSETGLGVHGSGLPVESLAELGDDVDQREDRGGELPKEQSLVLRLERDQLRAVVGVAQAGPDVVGDASQDDVPEVAGGDLEVGESVGVHVGSSSSSVGEISEGTARRPHGAAPSPTQTTAACGPHLRVDGLHGPICPFSCRLVDLEGRSCEHGYSFRAGPGGTDAETSARPTDSGPSAAPFSWLDEPDADMVAAWDLPREAFVRLDDEIAVLPSAVIAVTNDPKLNHATAVYLKGSGGHAYLSVVRPFAEVVELLEAARTGGTSPPS